MEEEKEKILTEKERLFSEYWLEEFNGADAARRAGYSAKSAKEIASENLTKPHIRAYIKVIQNNLAELSGLSKLRMLNRLKGIAFANVTDLFDVKEGEVVLNGKPKLSDFPKKLTSNIRELKNTMNGFGVKMYCADSATIQICKMLGYNEATKHKITATIKDASKLSDKELDEELDAYEDE